MHDGTVVNYPLAGLEYEALCLHARDCGCGGNAWPVGVAGAMASTAYPDLRRSRRRQIRVALPGTRPARAAFLRVLSRL